VSRVICDTYRDLSPQRRGAAQRYAQGSAENARGLCEIKFLTGATSFYSFNFTKKL
jgi:hypothetical protein